MGFNEEKYDSRKDDLQRQLNELNDERAKAKTLWAAHVEPLSTDDKRLLYNLLKEHLFGDE